MINGGLIETNKEGVVVTSRDLKLNFLTQNDLKSIKIAKSFNIKCFALSFTNNERDVQKFKKFFLIVEGFLKIESKRGLKNFKKNYKSR